MWKVLDSTHYDEPEVTTTITNDRPTLENTSSKDMLSMTSLKAVSNLSSESTQTKITKTKKKPKMSERDKKMLARMNKMREQTEKDILKKEQSLEKEASVVSEKALPKENTLSKIKEEKSMDIADEEEIVDIDVFSDSKSG